MDTRSEPEPIREARRERDHARAALGPAKRKWEQAQNRYFQAQLRLETLLDEYAGQMKLPLEES